MTFEYEIHCGTQVIKFKQSIDSGAISFNPSSLSHNQKILPKSWPEDQSSEKETKTARVAGGPRGGQGFGDPNTGGGGLLSGDYISVTGPFISICPCCDCAKVEPSNGGQQVATHENTPKEVKHGKRV
jgi:hypothetical protein